MTAAVASASLEGSQYAALIPFRAAGLFVPGSLGPGVDRLVLLLAARAAPHIVDIVVHLVARICFQGGGTACACGHAGLLGHSHGQPGCLPPVPSQQQKAPEAFAFGAVYRFSIFFNRVPTQPQRDERRLVPRHRKKIRWLGRRLTNLRMEAASGIEPEYTDLQSAA